MNPTGVDRGGMPYRVLVDRETYGAMIISPTRQLRRLLHVSGRQWKKLYKRANREAVATRRARTVKPPEA